MSCHLHRHQETFIISAIMKNMTEKFPLLAKINSPHDLRNLSEQDLPKLTEELRNYMIYCLDQCGGHFGANMGVVELTVALHYVYNTPEDRLIWDVGHQAYIHKILTGRRDRLTTIKQTNGLAPFPKRSESVYDCFGTGHSSTSISAALGMAVATQMDHKPNRTVAVIGDGGLTGGMAFEALNQGGILDPNLLVVLNDNEMSISKNVGALTNYLGRIISGRVYSTLRENSKKVLAKIPPISQFIKRTETHLKGMIVPGTIFEELGFNYVGPIDGHDLPNLIKTLRTLQSLKGAKLLHIYTVKGKGYSPAEKEQIEFHAVKPGFYSKTKKNSTESGHKSIKPTYSNVFGEWLCDMAAQDPNLIAITPAMCEGSGMIEFAKRFPNRFYDVGIAEQHSLTFAAGLACEGKKPVVAIYSTFLQRAYDQLIHDIALQNLDVTFAIDRAGLVGGDGSTHTGSFDLSYLRCIPNIIIMAPANENECRQMLYTAYCHPGPAAVRYPRGSGPNMPIQSNMQALPIGKAIYCRRGKRTAILAFGNMLTASLQAGDTLDATVVNMRFIKPMDEQSIREIAKTHNLIVTIEENVLMGGGGSAVGEFLARENFIKPLLQLGLPDAFIDHGNPDDVRAQCGLNYESIVKAINKKNETI